MPVPRIRCRSSHAAAASFGALVFAQPLMADPLTMFTPGDLVTSTVSSYNGGGLDTAAPIVLQQFQLSANGTAAAPAGTLTLPQMSSGMNSAISGEYGSASEGILERSVNGQYLTIMGYGVNATAFNNAPLSTFGTAALGQTTSLTAANQTGPVVTTVPRVVGLITANAAVDTSTALTGVFNTNNPRSAATVDGSSFYVSGQGVTGDGTGGVFYAIKGATTATAINANTTSPSGNPNGTANPLLATEARVVEIVNNGNGNRLYVSRDFAAKGSPNDTTDIRTLTSASGGLPTTSTGLVANRIVPGVASTTGMNTGSIDLTAALANGVNNARIGSFVYLSPEQYFFASPTVLYVADSGAPKNGNPDKAALGEGGLQKWVLTNGVWTLDYDLFSGLNLVDNATANSATPTAPGVTGLFGLTGEDVTINGVQEVELFATSYGLNELSPSFLYEITDVLGANSNSQVNGESFTTIYAAPAGTLLRGVAFAPVPEPATVALFSLGLAALGLGRRKRSV
jgi:hypothetical protein